MSPATTNSEAEILSRLIRPDDPSLSVDAARSIVALRFSDADEQRMDELAEKSRTGTLSALERAEIDSYERVGCLLGILQSKARLSLKNTTPDR